MLHDGVDDTLIAEFRVDHQIVERARGPFLAEIVANEGGAFAIDLREEFASLFFVLAEQAQAMELLVHGRVDEKMSGVGAIAQNPRAAAADDDAVAARGDVVDDALEHHDHLVRVKALDGKRAFVAAAREDVEEAMQRALHAFVAALDFAAFDVAKARDFVGEFLVPKFPAELVGAPAGDGGAAAAVFAFDGDDADAHGDKRISCWARRYRK